MKVAGLMPFRIDPKYTDAHGSIGQLLEMCDEVILLDDNSKPEDVAVLKAKYPKVREWMRLESNPNKPLWNDWTSHCVLMMEAARYDCDWCFWLDHDEVVWPKADHQKLVDAIESVRFAPTTMCIHEPWLQLWENDQQVMIGEKKFGRTKTFIQKNPFFQNLITWNGSPKLRLHCWPLQGGTVARRRDFAVLHYGLMTAEDRQYRVDKYNEQDPTNEYNDIWIREPRQGEVVQLKDIKLDDLESCDG